MKGFFWYFVDFFIHLNYHFVDAPHHQRPQLLFKRSFKIERFMCKGSFIEFLRAVESHDSYNTEAMKEFDLKILKIQRGQVTVTNLRHTFVGFVTSYLKGTCSNILNLASSNSLKIMRLRRRSSEIEIFSETLIILKSH